MRRGHSSREERKLHEISSIQWEVLHGLLLHHLAEIRGLRFQYRRRAVDRYHLRQFPKLNQEIDAQSILKPEHDASFLLGLESGKLHFDRVGARVQIGGNEVTNFVGQYG